MLRPYLLLAHYSPEGDGGAGATYDPYSEEGEGDIVSTSLSGDGPAGGGTGGADTEGSNAGPALGEAGKSAVVEIKDITGKEPAPGAASATKTPAAPAATGTAPEAFAGFAGGANEFAEKILGREKGLIQFEDEDAPVLFSELTPEEKQNVINQHIATQPTKEERIMLENVRKAGGVDAYTQRRAAALASSPAALSDDEVVQTALKKQFPDATDEELKAMFEHEKANPQFNRVVANHRAALTNEQKKAAADTAASEQRMFVEAARATPTINGVIISDDHRRELLGDLLTPDESDPTDPTSKFIKQFDDPKHLLDVAWYYRYGKPLLAQYLKGGPPKATRQPAAPGAAGGGGQKKEEVEDPYAN